METFWQDLRFSARMLVKSPGFSIIAVVALALGIGANTAIFSIVNAVLLRPLPYEDPGRLVVLSEETPQLPGMSVSYPNFLDWRDQNRAFEHLAAFRFASINITGSGEPERVQGRMVSANFFETLGVTPALGRAPMAEEDRAGATPVAVVSHNLWQQRLDSNPNLTGKTLTLDGRVFAIVGVMPAGFRFYNTPTDVFVPLGLEADSMSDRDSHPGIYVLARLKPGVTIEQARADMDAVTGVLAQQYPVTNSNHSASVEFLHEDMVGSIRPALLVLLAAVACVLLIACANVSNLLLARATAREKEIAIRSALGASRGRLVRQLLTESLVLSLAGGALGLLLAVWGKDLLVALGPASLPRAQEITIDGSVLGFTLLIAVATGIVFGLVPAFQAARIDLNEALKDGGRSPGAGPGRRGLRDALVVSEIALSLVLLVGAGLMIRSFVRLVQVDPGFDARNVLTAQVALPDAKYPERPQVAAFFERALERVRASPGVESASLITPLPLTGDGWQSDFRIEGRPIPDRGEFPNTDIHLVGADYFQAMGVPLVRGRGFTPADRLGAVNVAVINATMARREWPGEDPIGKRLKVGGPEELAGPKEKPEDWMTIVGVVGDVLQYGLDADPKTEVYIPHLQQPVSVGTLVVRAKADPASVTAAVREAIHGVDKDQPIYNVRTMEAIVSESVASRRLSMLLLGVFATVALVLAAGGVYGVMSYAVTQRTHEIGVRMALGAQPGDVLRLVVVQGMATVLVGIAVGLAGAFAGTRLMSNLLFGVDASDPATFVGIALLLTTVAFVASYIPARRAARVDPLVALRYE
jgi:putative ABC transport system permease protein